MGLTQPMPRSSIGITELIMSRGTFNKHPAARGSLPSPHSQILLKRRVVTLTQRRPFTSGSRARSYPLLGSIRPKRLSARPPPRSFPGQALRLSSIDLSPVHLPLAQPGRLTGGAHTPSARGRLELGSSDSVGFQV